MSDPSMVTSPAKILHQLGVAGRRIVRTTGRRLAGTLPPGRSPEGNDHAFRRLVDALESGKPPEGLRAHARLELPGKRGPWFDSGLELDRGEPVTWIATGRVYLSRLVDVFVEPHFQLWGRVGGGTIFSGTRASHTFVASQRGRLLLGSCFPGEWADPWGRLRTSPHEYAGVEGGMSVLLLRWRSDPLEGLRSWAGAVGPNPWIDGEIDRLENPVRPPDGWSYLWFLGDAEIFTAGTDADGEPCIDCRTSCDVGILRKEVDVSLRPDTRLSWSWKVDTLPSTIAEDTLPTHDYLSIAVEFENNIDLTYHWSAELPEGKGYWCPLPTWKDREFHVVIRSGTRDLGRWLDEERNVDEDYRRYVGGEPPARILRVWLIANSMLQRGEGRCSVRRIRVGPAGEETTVS